MFETSLICVQYFNCIANFAYHFFTSVCCLLCLLSSKGLQSTCRLLWRPITGGARCSSGPASFIRIGGGGGGWRDGGQGGGYYR